MTTKNPLYGNKNPLKIPAYSAVEVARISQVAPSTVRNWVFGERKVIFPASAKNKQLSFENLVEVHVLSALRKDHGVTFQQVRKAVRFLRKELKDQHPLASQMMLTDGVNIFVKHLGKLIGANQDGQQAITEAIEPFLKRVQRDKAGASVRLFPITRRESDSPAVDSPWSIAVDPRVRFGRPFLVDCGVETSAIADRVRAGESLEDLAMDFGVDGETILEAIRYELLAA